MAILQNPKFKKIRNVTLSVLKQVKDTEYYIKITGPMHLGKEVVGKPGANGEIKKKEPAHICEVVNLETGEPHILICPTVFRKELSECYPGDGYVGKCFAISFTRIDGKDYNVYTIAEIGEPDADDGADSTDTASAADTGSGKGKAKK